jgi:hypothetical protein
MPGQRLMFLLTGGLASLAVAGCGVDTAEDGAPAKASTTAVTTTTKTTSSGTSATTTTPARKVLPRRPSGTVAVDVQDRQGITAVAASAFGGARIALARTSEDRAYADLCAGRVDVIETSNVPTESDRRACKANGLEIADAIQTASDAIVLATKNASDVGGDCITVKQARDIFRAGSPYSNWSQLGFDDLRLRTVGREDGSTSFQFFGFQVLGINQASIADVRPDYKVFRRDQLVREEVTDVDRIAAANRRIRLRAAKLRSDTQKTRQDYIDAAVRRADRDVQIEIRRINAENKRLKITVNGPRLIRDNRLKVERAKRDARILANAQFEAALQRRVNAYRRGQLAVANAPGVVGPFRFSYYELFEEQLRPLEIDFGLPETESGQPTRYGDLTAAEQRRVAPYLRRVIARENGVSTTAASTQIPEDTTLAGLTSTQLPAKDRFGKAIYNLPNCVFPARTTITSGAYPLARRTFAVTTRTGLRRPEVVAFLKFYLEQSQNFSEQNNLQLVPITNQQRIDGLKIIGVTNPTLPADPVAPIGTTTTTTDATTTTMVGGETTTPATTTGATGTTATGTTTGTTTTGTTTTTPGAGSSSGIPGVSNRGG